MALHRRVVPAAFTRIVSEYLDENGLEPETVLGDAQTSAASESVPIEQWIMLLERAARHLRDPALGLRLGRRVSPRHLGVSGYVLLTSPTLGCALRRLGRYQRLVYDVTPMEYRETGGCTELVWGTEQGRPGSLADETAVTSLVQFCRNLVSRPLSPSQVRFVNPKPVDVRPYLDFFGCPVLFDCDETAVRFRIEDLDLPVLTADAGLAEILEHQAEQLLRDLPDGNGLVGQVRQAIGRHLDQGTATAEGVAATLSVEPRTMQRRLRAAGTSFSGERDRLRQQTAEAYLRDPRLKIAEIAHLLGYSEHSAFSRSFRQRTGVTPRQWRRRHMPDD